MTRELNLEEGIGESIDLILQVRERPILVAVYGQSNSGKSYFIDELARHLESEFISVGKSGGGPRRSTFEAIRDKPNTLRELLTFHCGWERDEEAGHYKIVFGHEDPNFLAREICGRILNLNVGIYNPSFSKYIKGHYDIVICNPDSVEKKRLV